MNTRTLTLEQAKAQYPQRFTMEHIPAWAKQPAPNGSYYAPQFRTDQEWYERTLFEGESELATKRHCYSQCPSWPLGQWLDKPYCKGERA